MEIKNKALPLHPQSEKQTSLTDAAEVLKNKVEKKVTEKFGSLNFLPYLCTTFRFEITKHESERKLVLWFTGYNIERKV